MSKIITVIAIAVAFAVYIIAFSGSVVWNALLVSVVLGFLSIWVPPIIFASFIVATLIVPTSILPLLSTPDGFYGFASFGFIRLHPASIVIFAGSVCNIMYRKEALARRMKEIKLLPVISLVFAAFAASIFMQTFLLKGFKGIPQCLENYLIPFSFFLYLLTLRSDEVIFMLKAYLGVILALALYGITEYFFAYNILYDRVYAVSSPHWYDGLFTGGYRITTTIGHPLTNAVYFLFAVPLALSIVKKPFNFLATALLCGAIFATGSRVASILSVCVVVAYYTHPGLNPFKQLRTLSAGAIVLITTYLALFRWHIGNTLIYRFIEGMGSSFIRMRSFGRMGDLSLKNLWLGNGMGFNFESSVDFFGYKTGYENPWLMLIVDVGFITALLYAAIILTVIFSRIKYLKSDGLKKAGYLSFITILIMLSSYNSFGVRDTIALLLWFNIAAIFLISAKNPYSKKAVLL